MNDGVAVAVLVAVGVGVGVGGYTICVTKLQASMDKSKSTKTIRFMIIRYL